MKEQSEDQALARRRPEPSDFDEALEQAAAQLRGGGDYGDYGTDDSQIREYWGSIRERLWLVLGSALMTTVLVTIYMARKPDIYAAEARVQVDLETSSSGGTLSKGGQVIVNSPVNDPNYFNTQLQVLSGPGLLRRVVETLDLEHNPEFLRPPDTQSRSTWQNLQRMFKLGSGEAPRSVVVDTSGAAKSLAPPSFRDDQAQAERLQPYVGHLQGSLRIEQVKDTRLIDITFSHTDPGVATKVVNTIADVFVLSNLEKKTDTNSTEADFLQKHIAQLQADIRNGEERLLNYTKNSQIVSFDANNTVVQRLVGLNGELLQAENERKLAQAAYQAAQAPGAAQALVKESPGQSSQAEGALNQLRQRRAQLLAKTTEEWPEVKEIDRQIAELQGQIEAAKTQSVATLLMNLKTRYEQTLRREEFIRSSFEQQKGETLAQNQAAINYKILQQEVETNKGLLVGLLQRSKENDMMMAGMANNIHVVDYAVKPRAPMGLNRLMGVALAFPISLVFGIGLALLFNFLDESVKSESDVERYLRLPTMGVIPRQRSRRTHLLLPAKYSNSLARRNGDGVADMEITNDLRSPIAEAYRHLRTSLLLSSVGGPPKTILVTSTLPNEGKTTTAVNLAVSLAQGGAEVLLIDGDLRRPALHTVFDLDNERGLSTIISSGANMDDILGMITPGGQSGLSLLTAGPPPPNPADHLGSEKMRLLIKMFESKYTHVVIDSPPLSMFTDGILLSTMAQSVLLVVEEGKGSRRMLRRASRTLEDVVANITGVVLNKVHLSRSDRYYYYREYYEATNGTSGGNGTNGTRPHSGSNVEIREDVSPKEKFNAAERPLGLG